MTLNLKVKSHDARKTKDSNFTGDPPMSSEEMRFTWGATDSGSTSGLATEKPKPWISASHLWVVYNTTELC